MRIFISNQTKVTPHVVIEAYQKLSITEDTSHVALDDFVLQDGSCSNAGFGKNCPLASCFVSIHIYNIKFCTDSVSQNVLHFRMHAGIGA